MLCPAPVRICLIALAMCLALAPPAAAEGTNFPEGSVRAINNEGFRACRALGNSGYTATASGILVGGSGPGSGRFRIRTCFETREACERFIASLETRIAKIDRLNHRSCTAR